MLFEELGRLWARFAGLPAGDEESPIKGYKPAFGTLGTTANLEGKPYYGPGVYVYLCDVHALEVGFYLEEGEATEVQECDECRYIAATVKGGKP